MLDLIFVMTSGIARLVEVSPQEVPWWIWIFPVVFLIFLGIGVWLRSRGRGVVKPEKILMAAADELKSQPRSAPAPMASKPVLMMAEPVLEKRDELAIISGIGPQVANLLRQAGIDSFSRLAATSPEQILEIIQASSLAITVDPARWPDQARLAADARWGDLQELQQNLR
jgi:predicted flap endonuclease-1-like 5' DNA nuclease